MSQRSSVSRRCFTLLQITLPNQNQGDRAAFRAVSAFILIGTAADVALRASPLARENLGGVGKLLRRGG